jgi:hypothetical protein
VEKKSARRKKKRARTGVQETKLHCGRANSIRRAIRDRADFYGVPARYVTPLTSFVVASFVR